MHHVLAVNEECLAFDCDGSVSVESAELNCLGSPNLVIICFLPYMASMSTGVFSAGFLNWWFLYVGPWDGAV